MICIKNNYRRIAAGVSRNLCSKRTTQRTVFADWGNVVIRPTVLNVELEIRTNAQQILCAKSHPRPERPAYAKELITRYLQPAANFLRRALTEADFFRFVIPALVGVPRVFAVNSRFEQYLFKRHYLLATPLLFSKLRIPPKPRRPASNVMSCST